jgi:signal transduction histidine kinase
VLAPVRANEAARDAAQDALAGFTQIGADIDIAEDIVLIADPEHLHRILVNLIRNAAQAISAKPGEGAGVSLRAERRSGAVAIMVADHGPGVPEALRDTLFDAFVTADRSGAGSGLGLAIARDLARLMGGEVTLARSSGAGAVFEVSLPAG